MKKLLLIVAGLLLMINVQAQDENGDASKTHDHGHGHGMWIGGSAGFGSLASGGYDYTIAPSWGMMINDNMGFGVTVEYSGGNDQSYLGLIPYFRYYIPVTDNFKFYGDGFVGYSSWDNDTTVDGGDGDNLNLGVKAGLQYWFTPKWSIAASTNILQYDTDNGKGEGEFGVGVDFSAVNFSLFFHF